MNWRRLALQVPAKGGRRRGFGACLEVEEGLLEARHRVGEQAISQENERQYAIWSLKSGRELGQRHDGIDRLRCMR